MVHGGSTWQFLCSKQNMCSLGTLQSIIYLMGFVTTFMSHVGVMNRVRCPSTLSLQDSKYFASDCKIL